MFSEHFIKLIIELMLESPMCDYTTDEKTYFYAKGFGIQNNDITIQSNIKMDIFTAFKTAVSKYSESYLMNDFNLIVSVMEEFNKELFNKLAFNKIILN